MSEYRWDQFEITFYYNAPLAAVYERWATANGLTSFFIESAQFEGDHGPRAANDLAQSGDSFSWQWRQDWHIDGKVLAADDAAHFAFTFGEMNVAIALNAVGNQTELHLLQTEIPNTPEGQVGGHLNCRSCWIFFLTNLTSVLDHGHDLRDDQPDRVSSMEVGFVPLSRRSIA